MDRVFSVVMSHPSWRVGALRISHIVEMDASAALQEIITEADPEALARAAWLSPNYVDGAGRLTGVIQSFLVEGPDEVTVIDTCVGNGKGRSGPPWDHVNSDFLQRFTQDLISPNDVSRVVCTHLHFDHVGWNTTLRDGVWRPTFPNARYVLSDKEFRYWADHSGEESEDHCAGVVDSVQPIADAGLLDRVADDEIISDTMRLIPSPGHTPHHVSVLLESQGERALITGDAVHHPCQIAYPDWSTISDFDPEQARRSRLELLNRFANSETAFIGTHFSAPAIGVLHGDEGRYFLSPFDASGQAGGSAIP
jgi:glyoxylase-like metal-dependent hydrolase (beta-lactamase superfamily II)